MFQALLGLAKIKLANGEEEMSLEICLILSSVSTEADYEAQNREFFGKLKERFDNRQIDKITKAVDKKSLGELIAELVLEDG